MAKRKHSIKPASMDAESGEVRCDAAASDAGLPAALKFLLGCGMAVLFTLLTVSLYAPTLKHEKILDDSAYVFDNPLLETGKSFLYPIALTGFSTIAGTAGCKPTWR